MDSMEWFIASFMAIAAIVLISLETACPLRRYRVRWAQFLENLTLAERLRVDLGTWFAVTLIFCINTWYFNESDTGMMAGLLLIGFVGLVINGLPLAWRIMEKSRRSNFLYSGIKRELRETFYYFAVILAMVAPMIVASLMAAVGLEFARWIAGR